MLEVTIKHVAAIGPGAFGVLLSRGVPFAVTLERTYEVGVEQRTKIPDGVYRCTRTMYHKGNYATFEIHVPGHSRILFHKANVEDELDGCVAVGEEFGVIGDRPAILQSGAGFQEFMAKTRDAAFFDLTVT